MRWGSLNVEERTFLSKLDWNLVIVILGLNIVGLVNLYSATHGPHSTEVESLFISQLMWLAIGWSVFFIATFIDYLIVFKIGVVIYCLNLVAIVYVTFFGKVALGAQRWIDL